MLWYYKGFVDPYGSDIRSVAKGDLKNNLEAPTNNNLKIASVVSAQSVNLTHVHIQFLMDEYFHDIIIYHNPTATLHLEGR
jgi:5'-3' exonuclease